MTKSSLKFENVLQRLKLEEVESKKIF